MKCKFCGTYIDCGEFCDDICERDYYSKICQEYGITDMPEIPDDFDLFDDEIPDEIDLGDVF